MSKEKDATVVTKTEARQGRRVGLVWVLVFALLLAAIAGVAFILYY